MANYTLKTDGTLEEALQSVISACNSTETAVNKTYADTVSYIQGALSKAAISESSTDEQFPTSKKVYDFVIGKGYLPKTAGEDNKVTGKLYLTNGLDLTGDLSTKGSIKLLHSILSSSSSETILDYRSDASTVKSKVGLYTDSAVLLAPGGEVSLVGGSSYIRFGTTQMSVTGNTFTFKNTASGGKTVTLNIASTDITGSTDTVALRGWVEKRLTEVAGETVTNAVTTPAEFNSVGNIVVVSETSSRKVVASTAKITATSPSLTSTSGDIPTVKAICGTIKSAVAKSVISDSEFPEDVTGRIVIVKAGGSREVEAYSANITDSAPELESSSNDIPRVVDICGTIKGAVSKMVVTDAQFTENEVGRIVVVAGKDSRSVKAYSANITNAAPNADSTSTEIPRVVDICKTIRTYAQPLNSTLTSISGLSSTGKGFLHYNESGSVSLVSAVQPVSSSFMSEQILVADVNGGVSAAKTTGYSIRSNHYALSTGRHVLDSHVLSYKDLKRTFLPICSSSGGAYADDINVKWGSTVAITHGSTDAVTHNLTKDLISLFQESVKITKSQIQLWGEPKSESSESASSVSATLGFNTTISEKKYNHDVVFAPQEIPGEEYIHAESYLPSIGGFLAHELEIFVGTDQINYGVNLPNQPGMNRRVQSSITFDSGSFKGSIAGSSKNQVKISLKKPCAITTGASDNPTDLMYGGLWIYPA